MIRPVIAASFVAFALAAPAAAQALDPKGTADAIVGSQVEEKETTAAADPARVIAAIDKAGVSADAVRKLSNAPKVEIVFLPDAAQTEGGPPAEIDAKLKERDVDIKRLRQEIEANALLYHAIDSRQVLIRDVLGVDVTPEAVIVYAAAKPAG